MRKLFLTIYLVMLGIIVVSVVTMATLVHTLDTDRDPVPRPLRRAAAVLVESLDPATLDADLHRRARGLDMELALYDADKRLIAHTAPPPAGPCEEDCGDGTWLVGTWGHGARIRLDDGRWLVATLPHGRRWRRGARGLLFAVGFFGLVTGVASYPVARRITRRLERLARGVDRWGEGDLAARVPVEGSDEIANLAGRFNDAAERVEALVASQRRMLAFASHELRTPLARLRVALTLVEEGEPPSRWARAAHDDVQRLDDLIDVLLTSARLDDSRSALQKTRFDLTALAAEVTARHDVALHASEVVEVAGERALLERVLVNLVDNAAKHGARPVTVHVRRDDHRVHVIVDDAGPGVATADRERIFQPFERVDPGATGVGLGLALVRRIVEAHEGTMSCRESPDGGARFHVELRGE